MITIIIINYNSSYTTASEKLPTCVSMFLLAPFPDADLSQGICQSISSPKTVSSLASLGEVVKVNCLFFRNHNTFSSFQLLVFSYPTFCFGLSVWLPGGQDVVPVTQVGRYKTKQLLSLPALKNSLQEKSCQENKAWFTVAHATSPEKRGISKAPLYWHLFLNTGRVHTYTCTHTYILNLSDT